MIQFSFRIQCVTATSFIPLRRPIFHLDNSWNENAHTAGNQSHKPHIPDGATLCYSAADKD